MLRQRVYTTTMNKELTDQGRGFEQIMNAEDRLTLEKAFTILPENTCRIIMLHAISGMKHREIAELLNMLLSTILSKYNRGIKKLQSELEGML